MKEAVILQSPHAYVPKMNMTEAEKAELYRTRLDETFHPYTVVDVLTNVYHRCMKDDLSNYIGKHPGEFVPLESGWCVSRVWVNACRIIRVESLFFQPITDFRVELYVEASMRIEIVRSGNALSRKIRNVRTNLRLQYSFDLRPCKLTCQFNKAVVHEVDSLIARHPKAIRADKYLLPVLHESDYPYLAKWLRALYDIDENEIPLDAELLAEKMGLKILQCAFPENGVMGEIYFSFGHAAIIHPATGEIKDTNINPGTIIVNPAACASRGMYNVTLLHECAHRVLAISENMKTAIRHRVEAGVYTPRRNLMLGYDVKDGRFVPNADAHVIRHIFTRYAEGAGIAEICRELNEKGAKRLKVDKPFSVQNIQYILSNETYVGDKQLQKRAPRSFLTGKPDPTQPYATNYLIDDHEPIISREVWDTVQERLKREERDRIAGFCKQGNSHELYGRLFCASCGEPYMRCTFTRQNPAPGEDKHYKV